MKYVVSMCIGDETTILLPRGLLPNERCQVAHAYLCPKRAGYERVDQCLPHAPDWHYGVSLTLLWKEAPEVGCESAIWKRFDGSRPGRPTWEEQPVDEDLERCTQWCALPDWGCPCYLEVSHHVARQRNEYWGGGKGWVSEEDWSNLTWED